nr:retrovirus-related Pol polyprotein from transposon TNT 1-94 [Tanacetum cinerariifolium]
MWCCDEDGSGVVEWLQWWGDGCGGEAAMDEREVVTAVVGDGWRLVWDDGGVGEDVVVRWWHEGVGSSGGCGVACRLGWLEFWPDGEGGAEKLFEEGGGIHRLTFSDSKYEAPETIITFLKQNRSIINTIYKKNPYELINGRKPNISYFHVFDALCYPYNDREDLWKLKAKGDIGFFIEYFKTGRGYRIYNRRKKKVMEKVNVKLDELLAMASKQRSLDPALQ